MYFIRQFHQNEKPGKAYIDVRNEMVGSRNNYGKYFVLAASYLKNEKLHVLYKNDQKAKVIKLWTLP